MKVQHRGLRETSAGDVFAITTVTHVLDYLFDDFSWMWIADEIAPHVSYARVGSQEMKAYLLCLSFKQLPIELDFCNEGRNSEKAFAAIQKSGLDCVVPKVLWNHSSERVLCMEYEEGFRSTDVEAIDKAGLKRR